MPGHLGPASHTLRKSAWTLEVRGGSWGGWLSCGPRSRVSTLCTGYWTQFLEGWFIPGVLQCTPSSAAFSLSQSPPASYILSSDVFSDPDHKSFPCLSYRLQKLKLDSSLLPNGELFLKVKDSNLSVPTVTTKPIIYLPRLKNSFDSDFLPCKISSLPTFPVLEIFEVLDDVAT